MRRKGFRLATCKVVATLAGALLLGACHREAAEALGTLEYDRITLPSPAAERIATIQAHEGDRVQAGQVLLQLDASRSAATVRAAQEDVQVQRQSLAELQAGPRKEAIAQARAQLAAAQAQARDAQAYYARLQPLGRQQLVAAADVDRAHAAAGNANAQVQATAAALAELEHGTRVEQLAQGEAALQASRSRAQVQQITLDKLDIVAPRAGVIDSLPYKLGDQAPIGSPLAVLLVGDAPYARVYIPEQRRAGLHIGSQVTVHVEGRASPIDGRVRMIRDQPSFTPYYALTGSDVAHLSYLAEIALGKDAASLPAGLPVRVELAR